MKISMRIRQTIRGRKKKSRHHPRIPLHLNPLHHWKLKEVEAPEMKDSIMESKEKMGTFA
jgi:hypothetical protein